MTGIVFPRTANRMLTIGRPGTIMVVVLLLVGLLPTVASAQAAPVCPASDAIVIEFDGRKILADLTEADAISGPVAATIPAGT